MLAGMLGLALLEASLSSTQAAGRVGGLLGGLATVVQHVLSPTVPAIPDLRKHGGAAPAVATSGGSLLPAEWTTAPTAPAPSTPSSQIYF